MNRLMSLSITVNTLLLSDVLGRFCKFNFRRDTALLIKNFSLHIKCKRRQNFLIAPCLA